jgi:hypothetical protein
MASYGKEARRFAGEGSEGSLAYLFFPEMIEER